MNKLVASFSSSNLRDRISAVSLKINIYDSFRTENDVERCILKARLNYSLMVKKEHTSICALIDTV